MTLEANDEFESLLEYIRETRGFDFSGYKRPTLLRRVGKRCNELGLETFAAYHDYLQVHPDEFAILFDTILINVTGFFRDPEAWEYLERNIVPLITSGNDPIRIWSTGTASGEEAYSVAIMFCEALGPEQFLHRVKIYATDVDEQALGKARSGYTAKDLEKLDPDLRARYFEPAAGRFNFRQALRRALIFGRHDLMQDAPISRLDLLICRNTLMYFTSEAQGRILARFHYAMNDDAYLFLGRAEMLLTHAALFSPVDLKQRVFSKVPRLQLRDRLLLLAQAGTPEAGNHVAKQIRLRELAAEGNPNPQVVIDALSTIAMANNAARRTFHIGPGDIGRPLKDLEMSYKPVNLRAPIDQVLRDKRSVVLPAVEHMAGEGSFRQFDVHIVPLLDDDLTVVGISVSFIDVTQVGLLRNDLERARQEVETAYEELQSSNEELETTNEELQSTVEELETTNSELQAINTDVRTRTDEVAKLNTFLLAITGKIPIAAIVLDDDFAIQVWNERAADMWGLRSDEVVGESLFSLDIGLPVKEIRTMLRSVARGKPLSDELIVDGTNRRGKPVKVRVVASVLPAGRKTAGLVVLIEELKNSKSSS